ncbi:MAG: tRNA modification GTPase [Lachnospiraceae bacterium]|nr:tRNA modification GTPase [Lachnospiraceae bacterium]
MKPKNTVSEKSEDTIAAIATGQVPAGIGILRISGGEAIAVGDRVFRNLRDERVLHEQDSGRMRHGFVVDETESRIDEVMAVVFRGPHSYTGEDMVELQCHGGLFVLRRVLETVLSAGARPAEPGEFTRRAFLNGRIDLTQAEAVMDVIAAENDFALKNAERQIGGALQERIRTLREKLLRESAFIEAALDDPESFTGELTGYADRLRSVVSLCNGQIADLLSHAQDGILLREGVRCAIIGRPNAGKSSLLNLLAGRERSIVTEIPGTTRDTVEESVRIGDLTLHLIDTAGLMDPADNSSPAGSADPYDGRTENAERRRIDPVERIGIERARQALKEAELILFVVDQNEPVTEETIRLFKETAGKRRILLWNKIDLRTDASSMERDTAWVDPEVPVVRISAKTGEGRDDLERALTRLLLTDDRWQTQDFVISSVRHERLLIDAQTSLTALLKTIDEGLTEDFYTVDLMNAYRSLGEIIGEEVGEDLVNEIFSRFCMGK